LQGGIFSAREAEAFIARPGGAQAARLRVWDDQAKTAGLTTPPLSHFLERAGRCALAR
jgi:predicted HD phosphohydrolase